MTSERIAEIPQGLQILVENFALDYLNRGRVNWDEPHTRAVSFYAVDLARKNNLNVKVLYTAAWLHDTGYNALFEVGNSDQYDPVQLKKEEHMIKGEIIVNEFFENRWVKGWFLKEEEKRVAHLVRIHDKVNDLIDLDEIVLMEADTLGAIDISRVKPTYNKEEAEKYIKKSLEGKRVPKFQTKDGKAYLEKLLLSFKEYYRLNDAK